MSNIIKTCRKCDKPKELDCFRDNKKTKDRKFPWCRECQDERNKSLYAKNKQKRLAQILKWNNEHPDKLKSYQSNWRKNKQDAP